MGEHGRSRGAAYAPARAVSAKLATPRAKPTRAFVATLSAALLASVTAGVLIGRGGLPMALDSVFLSVRIHRVVVAFCAGAALSVAGAIVQGLFRNPLANPSILGTTSGALLGAHLALLGTVLWLGGGGVLGVAPEMMLPMGAMLGAGASLFALLLVVSFRVSALVLLLTGWALMSAFQSVSTLLNQMFQEAWELNRAMAALNVGSISSVGGKQAALGALMTLGGAVPALWSAPTLDVLLTGEEEAESLGVDVARERFWLVVWVAVLSAGAVAVGGSVGFVGLIVPHALRPWVGQRHRYLLPSVFVAGGTFVIACDVVCRVLPLPVELPLGVVTELLGAPLFLRMLLRLARGESAP